jgi:hypothetical protein
MTTLEPNRLRPHKAYVDPSGGFFREVEWSAVEDDVQVLLFREDA